MTTMFHKHGGDIYSYKAIQDFSANINFRGMPESVRAAAVRAVDASVHYPDPEYRTLRTKLARRENLLLIKGGGSFLQENHYHKILPEQVICGNGAAELMFSLAMALKPRHALLAAPSFFEYEQALSVSGCAIRYFYLSEKENFRLGEAFLEAIDEHTDMIILGSPNNPTGQLIEATVLRKLLKLCEEKQIFLVLDESFFDFLTKKDRVQTWDGAQGAPAYNNLFVIKSFTKMYGMPGLRFGYGICSDTGLLEKMRAMMQPWNVSVPAQAAAEAAAAELDFAEETAAWTAENRRQMKHWMAQAGYRVFPSNTNFLLFQAPAWLKEFCAEKGFLIRDCSNFPGLDTRTSELPYFRICVRSSQENGALMEVLECAARIRKD